MNNAKKDTWHLETVRNDHSFIVDDATGKTIAVVFNQDDARIIAASRKMLEALEYVSRLHPKDTILIDIIRCRDAIAEAKGVAP
jgi:hypothetical protein